jgi:hypothetical protein
LLVEQKKVSTKSETVDYAKSLYTQVQLCKTFGWTFDYIETLPTQVYEDVIAILNLEAFKEKVALEEKRKPNSYISR